MTADRSAVAVIEREASPRTALVLGADQERWDEAQLAALRSIGVENAPQGELDLFFHTAKRSQLDPFTKQIYLIKRRQKVGDQWVDKWSIQTAIDGFRVIRDRIGGFAGQREQWCGPDGVWRDVWLGPGYPAAARVLVFKHGYVEPVPGIARWSEFAAYRNDKPTAMWGRMPALMLAKCAEALALRKAFPQDFSGLYIAEEMDQAQDGVTTPQAAASRANAAPAADRAGADSETATKPSTGRWYPDVLADARRTVLSCEFKGSQTVKDGGLRTVYQRVREAGLLEAPFEPGSPQTFRDKMRELSEQLPDEKPKPPAEAAAGDSAAQPMWQRDANGWEVPPDDQPI